jgi:hypothetical protein
MVSELRATEWTQFQTHYFSENLVAPGIEPEPLSMYCMRISSYLSVSSQNYDWILNIIFEQFVYLHLQIVLCDFITTLDV